MLLNSYIIFLYFSIKISISLLIDKIEIINMEILRWYHTLNNVPVIERNVFLKFNFNLRIALSNCNSILSKNHLIKNSSITFI